MLEQLARERVERRLHGAHLRQDVDAVAIVVDHPPDAADLSFDAIEAFRQRGGLRVGMRDRRMTMRAAGCARLAVRRRAMRLPYSATS